MNHQHSDAPPAFFQSNARFCAALLLIFVFGLALRWYYITHKTYVHLDESASITLSTYTAHGWDKYFAEDTVYTGDELRKLSYAIKPGLAGLAHDVLRLRTDNRDLPHTNLYYSLLRAALTDMSAWDIRSLLLRGNTLNILFFSITFVVLYKLGRTVYGNDRSILLTALAAATCNPAAISSVLLVRTYEMQTLTLALVAWISMLTMQRIRQGSDCPEYGTFFLHGFAIAFCLLSGYFALFYVALLGLLLMGFALIHRQGRYLTYLLCLLALALIMAWAAFSPFLIGLFYDRGAEASQKISLTYVVNNAGYIFDKFTYLYSKHVTSIVGVAVLMAGAWLSRGRFGGNAHARVAMALLTAVLLWSLTSFILAPYKTLRYMMAAAPVVLLLACTFLQQARYRAVLLSLFLLGTVPLIFFPGSVEYYKNEERLPQNSTYVVSLTTPWLTAAVVPYIADDQEVIFYNSCTSLRESYPKHPGAVLLIDDAQFAKCAMESVMDLHKEQEYTYFSTYSVHAKTN